MGVSTLTKWFDKLINPDRGQTLVYDAQRGQPAVYELGGLSLPQPDPAVGTQGRLDPL